MSTRLTLFPLPEISSPFGLRAIYDNLERALREVERLTSRLQLVESRLELVESRLELVGMKETTD